VSAFAHPGGFPERLVTCGKSGAFVVVTSAPLLRELLEVLSRPRILRIRGMSASDAVAYARIVSSSSVLVPITGMVHLCRDPEDDMVIETAIAGRASHIVSRDEDLTRDVSLVRELAARGIQCVTVNAMLDQLDPANRGLSGA
jgi:putative PIN family toxin of toxin-antitoxin system